MAGDKPTRQAKTNKVGRPSSYSLETAQELCSYLSMGESLKRACEHEGMPTVKTVFNWFGRHEEFLQLYTRAKEEAADALAEEILDISDNTDNDILEDNEGRVIPNSVRIQRDRLRVDTRKFLMAKMKPKRYGDKLDVTSGGEKLPTPLLTGLSIPSGDIKSDDESQE